MGHGNGNVSWELRSSDTFHELCPEVVRDVPLLVPPKGFTACEINLEWNRVNGFCLV